MIAARTAARVAAIAANAVSGVAALRLALELAASGGKPAARARADEQTP